MLFARASLKPPAAPTTLLFMTSGYPVLFARASLKRGRHDQCVRSRTGYPVLFARASLKPADLPVPPDGVQGRYPVLFARASLKPWSGIQRPCVSKPVTPCFLRGASLKHCLREGYYSLSSPLPRAFCAGLIEAFFSIGILWTAPGCYPVLFARASLKLGSGTTGLAAEERYPVLFARASLKPVGLHGLVRVHMGYPVLFARASLKPGRRRIRMPLPAGLPRAFCAGLIEACRMCGRSSGDSPSYPVLFARASLKLSFAGPAPRLNFRYPVLFARASLKLRGVLPRRRHHHRYPVLFARASLKRLVAIRAARRARRVTPCFLRGPH